MNYEQLYEGKNQDYYLHSRPEIIPFVPADCQTVLDVGCGNGGFGLTLKAQRACTVWGIEPNKEAARDAEDKLDKVINGLFVKDMPELHAIPGASKLRALVCRFRPLEFHGAGAGGVGGSSRSWHVLSVGSRSPRILLCGAGLSGAID